MERGSLDYENHIRPGEGRVDGAGWRTRRGGAWSIAIGLSAITAFGLLLVALTAFPKLGHGYSGPDPVYFPLGFTLLCAAGGMSGLVGLVIDGVRTSAYCGIILNGLLFILFGALTLAFMLTPRWAGP
jgi:hypothetical protein